MGRRTLVVDDHPLTRAALVGLLEQHDFPVVAEAGDGQEAIDRARELQPDIVLLDLSMPGMGGLEALPRVRAAAPDCEVVVLTASGTEENLLAAIRAGAAGYLLKTEPPERIAEFLAGVAHGEAALSGEVARRLLDRVRDGGRLDSGVPESIADQLSAREVEVLDALARPGSLREVADQLFISRNTIKTHTRALYAKLGVASRDEAVEKGRALGLLREPR